ncbi:DNA mismatch repair protein MutS [Parafrigoribacterium mesophilum]|uniref:MutS-related protein n=1 Tax=Parafrigoribacterium mesophilum TaxID=433646 RepID=UPI0031FC3395
MKAFLLYRDRDFDFDAALPANTTDLTEDLGLDTLLTAMAQNDRFLLEISRKAVLTSASEPDAIVYRQDILTDCLKHPAVVRQIYDTAVEALDGVKKTFWSRFSARPDTNLQRSVELLELFMPLLERLRTIADEHSDVFASEGLTRFFRMLRNELDDEYLRTVEDHVRRLRFRTQGVLISAELGPGNAGRNYTLLRRTDDRRNWLRRMLGEGRPHYYYKIPERDENGAKALGELRIRGINLVANALSQSTDHIQNFFTRLRAELAFYIGCLNAHMLLTRIGGPICLPVPERRGRPEMSCAGLYDIGLSLNTGRRVVGNDMGADGRPLVMITGANQGGKSTFLRSVGLAQLMMQCGMFVAAESFRSSVRSGIFTHYRREEDATMTSGKFDEELRRMSALLGDLHPGSMILFNESFAATNEREGSQIARQIIRALLEGGARVFFVTHQYDLANGFYRHQPDTTLFLRAERTTDGRRSFTLVEGEPLPTSFGRDLYERIFEGAVDATRVGV